MLNIHLQVTYFDQHLIGIAYGGLYAGLFGSLFFSFSFFPRFSTSLQGPRSRAGQTRRCSSAPPPAGEKGGRTPLRLFLFLQNPTELAASEITAGTLGEKNSEMPGHSGQTWRTWVFFCMYSPTFGYSDTDAVAYIR